METRQRRTRRITREHAAEIGAAYSEGYSLSQIATYWDISLAAVSLTLDKLGIPKRHGGPRPAVNGESQRARAVRVLSERKAEIIERYKTERMDDIAADLDINRGAITRMLREEGVKIRPRGAAQQVYGPGNPAYKAGRYTNSDGYVRVLLDPNDPLISMADKKRYVLEHRLVMARLIGRPLMADESVHHIDGDRGNNTAGNLQLRRGQHGKHIHVRCHDCGSQNVGPVAI